MAAAAVTLLTGCGMANSSCPPLTEIDAETQRQAAQQLEAVGTDSALAKVITAASAERDKIRACHRVANKWEPWRKS